MPKTHILEGDMYSSWVASMPTHNKDGLEVFCIMVQAFTDSISVTSSGSRSLGALFVEICNFKSIKLQKYRSLTYPICFYENNPDQKEEKVLDFYNNTKEFAEEMKKLFEVFIFIFYYLSF